MSRFLSITRNLVLLATAVVLTTPFANAQVLGKAELKKLVATASTPQDHERIAKHFDAKAAQYEADAKDHEELAAEYKASRPRAEAPGMTAEHCLYVAQAARRTAEEAQKVAADHRAMARATK